MSEYDQEKRCFIINAFYATGDSHSETIEKFVQKFGPDNVPTAETIDRLVEEFEAAVREFQTQNSSKKSPTNDNINETANKPEMNIPEPEHNEIAERPDTSTGICTDSKQNSPSTTKRKRNESISSPQTTRSRERQRVADLLATGLTQDEIAETIGISKGLVSTIIAIDLATELPARRTKKTRTSDEISFVTVTTENESSTTKADKAEKIKASTSKVNETKDDLCKNQETRKTSEKNEIKVNVGPSTSTDNDNNIRSDLSGRLEAFDYRPEKYCGLPLLKKMVQSNDQQEIEEIARQLGIPKDNIDRVRRNIGFGSHFPRK